MGFDAGSITATMRLDSSEFDATAEEVQAKKDELASEVTFNVKPELDETAVEEVELEKEENATDVTYDVKPEINEADKLAVDAEKEAEKESVSYEVKPTFRDAVLENVAKDLGDSFARDLGKSLSSPTNASVIDRQLGNLLSGGLQSGDLADTLAALGNPAADIAAALERAGLGAEGAPLLAAAILPTEVEFSSALESGIAELTSGAYSLPGGGEGKLNIGTGILTGLLDNIATDSNGDQLALNAGLGDGVHFADEYMDGLYRSFAHEAPMVFDNNGEQLQLGDGIVRSLDAAVKDSLSKSGNGGGGGILSSIVSSIVGDGSALSLPAVSTPAFVATLAPILLPGIAALGGVLGGMLAGTIIGGLGTATFGVEALKAISGISTALSTQKELDSGQITQTQANSVFSTLTPGAAAAAQQILPFLQELEKIIDQQNAPIFGIISKFLESLAKDTPLIGPYLDAVTKAMGGFFQQVDSGLDSKGFSSFATDMTNLTGPVMTDFGNFILAFGKAIGDWLVMMGPLVTTIGPGFASLAGDLDKFIKNTQITPAFLQTIKDLGKDFSDAWGLIEQAVSVGANAAGPLASAIFSQIPTVSGFLRELLKAMPKDLTSDILAVVLALTAFSKIPTLTVILLGLDALDHIMQALGIHMTPKLAAGIEAVAAALIILNKLGAMDAVVGALAKVAGSILGIEEGSGAAGVLSALGGAGATAAAALGPLAIVLGTIVGLYEILKPIKLSSGDIDATQMASELAGMKAGSNGATPLDAAQYAQQIRLMNQALATDGSPDRLSSTGQVVAVGAPHAMGGPVMPGVAYPVGENGVELFQPNVPGNIIPNSALGSGGRSLVFQIDARGATNPTQVKQQAQDGVISALPSLTAALARGSGS